MRMSMVSGLLMIGAAVAGVSAPARAGMAGQWRGVLLRDGLQVPISVELAGANQQWSGQLRIEDSFAPIQGARANAAAVHFEVPGAGVFDGTVAGDSMAGSVSGGPAAGSFSLTRESESPFGDAITSSGP